MITEKFIKGLVEEKIVGTDCFLVEVEVLPGNKIFVRVDSKEGLKVKDYVSISRHIEGSIDREEEDFSLEVSSPGLSRPFRVREQYEKYLGKEVEILLNDGVKFNGVLQSFGENELTIQTSRMERLEGKKKKELITEDISLELKNIKETKIVITF